MRLPTHPKTWLLAGAGIALAALSTVDAAGNAYRSRAPQIAAMLPGESQAQVEILQKTAFRPDGISSMPAKTFPIAKRALRDEPLNADALHLLAFASDPRGTSAEAVKYARLANRVSRRDLAAQLVLVAASARSGKTAEALEHLDAALRTRMSSRPLIFPMLKRALEDTGIQREFGKYLVQRSPWALEFTSYVMDDPVAAPRIAAVIIRTGSRMNREDLAIITPPLITRLIEANDMALVPGLLGVLSHRDAGQLLKTADFTTVSTSPKYGAAAWQVRNEAAFSSTFLVGKGSEAPILSLYGAPGANGVVASKVLTIPAGRYSLQQRVTLQQSVTPGQTTYWRLTCLSKQDNRIAGKTANILDQTPGRTTNILEVPQNCPTQKLDLVMQVPFGQAGLDVSIERLHLARI